MASLTLTLTAQQVTDLLSHFEGVGPLRDVAAERARQDIKWGEQNHPDGTGLGGDAERRDVAIELCDRRHRAGVGTWRDILDEETAEAYTESDPAALRAELVQVAAVAVAWIESIDRRLACRT